MATDGYEWDVFVSHNRRQKPWVRQLTDQWRELGLKVFFDDENILPGEDIVTGIERGLTASRHVVLVITPSSMASRWVAMEVATTIFEDPDAGERRLIPLLLEQTENIRPTVRRLNLVDLTDPDSERRLHRYHLLLRSLGVDAHRLPPPPELRDALSAISSNQVSSPVQTPVIPSQGVARPVRIELRIDREFSSFTETEQTCLLRAIKELLSISGDIRVTDKREGSTLLTLELSASDAKRLAEAIELGQLHEFGVVAAKLEDADLADLRAGDESAFQRIFRRFSDPLVNRSKRMIRGWPFELAEDAVMESFVRFLRWFREGRFGGRALSGREIGFLLHRFTMSALKPQVLYRSQAKYFDLAPAEEMPAMSSESAFSDLLYSIEETLRSQKDESLWRTFTLLMEGHTYHQIAELEGCSVKLVHRRVDRIRDLLRPIISDDT